MEDDEIAATSGEEISEISDEESEPVISSDDEFIYYHPYTSTSATSVQREDFLKQKLNEAKQAADIDESTKTLPSESQGNKPDKESELKNRANKKQTRFKELDPDFIPRPHFPKKTPEVIKNRNKTSPVRKRSFLSKFGLHWHSSSNSNPVESTMGVGSGDKKPASGSKSVKNNEIVLWGGSTVDRMIGDYSKPYALPVIMGLHSDLNSVTPNIMMGLFKGFFEKEIESFRLLDCRYPYEYESGHIRGALNIYTREQIAYLLSGKAKDFEGRRNILIFYSEFSSERAPSLCRYLRDEDRNLNKILYPRLNYPEIYLMAGGYKKFYTEYPSWCIPQDYKPMLHPDHAHELQYFRIKLKNQHVYFENAVDLEKNNTTSEFYNELGLLN